MNSIIVPNLEVFYSSIDYKATEFSGTLRSSEEGEVSWMQKDQIPNLDLAYDTLPLMEMMEAPDKSEFFYHYRTEDGWAKKIF
ncbi:NTP pyrophosphohydrolase [Streptococcus mitis]